MKLLIITQKIDINDDLLGFVHGWITELAKRCEKITVIALGVAEYHLPENVKVLSLGKEKNNTSPRICHSRESRAELGESGLPADRQEIHDFSPLSVKGGWEGFNFGPGSRVPCLPAGRKPGMTSRVFIKIKYIFIFFKYIWQYRNEYDAVFVHMNKEYVVLGGIFWRLAGKKIILWYNHNEGNFESRLAGLLAQRIFYTSKFSFFARKQLKKGQLMPAGIDTAVFKPQENVRPLPFSLLFLGRISPIKNLDVLIDAANILEKKNINFVLDVVGEPGINDFKYLADIKELARDLEAKGKIKFLGKISNPSAPDYYNRHEIFVNLTNSGSFDKTTLEAMACERLVLVSNRAYEDIFSGEQRGVLMFQEKNAEDLAEKIEGLFKLNEEAKMRIVAQMREIVVLRHGLEVLADKLFKALAEK